ncbi:MULTISPECIES: DUF6630 family protein [unclassified Granulicatella]|jgi:hypothetical protein|uniref:DUF6630 family protein n=1 Tax=unclassified Granulicatella TaxID=2630493 RepID=UPI00066EB788|nr:MULTISPECIES: hypothetical protein [unclassified Granulicatella]
MWLFNRKSRRKDEFELEETLDSETVEVDSDSDEDCYLQISEIITDHNQTVKELLENYFEDPRLLLEEFQEDCYEWNEDSSVFQEELLDDYWLILLLTLEKESYAKRIYWRDNVETVMKNLKQLKQLKEISLDERLSHCNYQSLAEFLECISMELQKLEIIIGTFELDDENVLLFSMMEKRMGKFNKLVNTIEKSWKQIS